MTTLNPDNIAQHLIAMGYSAKAGAITDKTTGKSQPVVFINGLGSINAYLNLSEDPTKFGLKVFGNLQEGYAPVVLDASGDVVRETVRQNGQSVTRAKRGEPLDADALKRKNNEISLAARKDITAAVIAAYLIEENGGDLEKIRAGFRLQKWERSAPKAVAEGVDQSEAAPEVASTFNEAAAPEASDTPTTEKPGSQRRVKRSQTQSLSL